MKIKENIHSLKNADHVNKISYILPVIWLLNLDKLISPSCRGLTLSEPSRKLQFYNINYIAKLLNLKRKQMKRLNHNRNGEDIQFLLVQYIILLSFVFRIYKISKTLFEKLAYFLKQIKKGANIVRMLLSVFRSL